MVLEQSLPGTQGLFLMAAVSPGFQLIITANLSLGQCRRFKLKARRLFHARYIFDGTDRKKERKRGEVILEVFDK